MLIVEAGVGLVLLFFGRTLFWVFVAAAGFLLGARISEILLVDRAAWIGLLAALGAGVAGAFVAVLAQRVGFALAGLFSGGYLALAAAESLHLGGSPTVWMAVGGIAGAVIALLVMDWALILLSSLVGAGVVVRALDLGPLALVLAYVVMAALGVAFQASRMAARPEPPVQNVRKVRKG